MKRLSGSKGCKRMARQLIRQERQAHRDTHAGGQKKSNKPIGIRGCKGLCEMRSSMGKEVCALFKGKWRSIAGADNKEWIDVSSRGRGQRQGVCLLWKRTYYDLLVMPDSLWSRADRRDSRHIVTGCLSQGAPIGLRGACLRGSSCLVCMVAAICT